MCDRSDLILQIAVSGLPAGCKSSVSRQHRTMEGSFMDRFQHQR